MNDAVSRHADVRSVSVSLWSSLLLLIVVCAVYAGAVDASFVFDDLREIVAEPRNRSLWPLGPHFDSFRPLVSLSLACNVALAGGGFDPVGFHVFNIGVHVAAVLLLHRLVTHTPALRRFAQRHGLAPGRLGFAIALLWGVHPLGTQAVTYAIQRAESMMALFYIALLYAVVRHAESRALRWSFVAVGATVAGMACKAVMITAPVVALMFDALCVSGSLLRAWRERRVLYLALFCTWLVAWWTGRLSGLVAGASADASVGFGVAGITPLHYLASQPAVLLHYLRLSVWPTGQALDLGWQPAVLGWWSVTAAVLVSGLLGLTLWWAWRGRAAAFFGLAFFVVLAPTSSVVPVADLANEHRMYLPLAALVAGLCCLGCVALRSPAVRLGVGLLIAVALGWTTVARNRVYSSQESLWRDVVATRPDNPRGYANLSQQQLAAGDMSGAVATARRGTERDAATLSSWRFYGVALTAAGRDEEAIAAFAVALDMARSDGEAKGDAGLYRDAAVVSERYGDATRALQLYGEALGQDPWHIETLDDQARLLRRMGRPEDAAPLLRRALRRRPSGTALLQHLALVQSLMGQHDAACETALRAVDSAADSSAQRFMAASVLKRAGRLDDALLQCEAAFEMDADSAAVRAAIVDIETRQLLIRRLQPLEQAALEDMSAADAAAVAGLRWRLDRRDAALEAQERAVAASPGDAAQRLQLGEWLLALERFDSARRAFERALEVAPRDPRALAGLGLALAGGGDDGDAERAVPLLERALQLQSDAIDLQLGLGTAYLRCGRASEALQRFGAATQLDFMDAGARRQLAVAMEAMGRVPDALRELRLGLRYQPDDVPLRRALDALLQRASTRR